MRKHFTLLVIIPLIALTMVGVAYAHWQDIIRINAIVKTGEWCQSIGSSKVVTPVGYDENRSIESSIINDDKTLRLICANISKGWHIWAGILIHNEGTVPTTVKSPHIEFINANRWSFTIKKYFYGPYNRGEHTSVWSHAKMDNLPFKPYKNEGITLNPCQKAVIWIEFQYNEDSLIEEATIYITIRYDVG